MESFQFDKEIIHQQYKLQQLQFSSVVLQAFLKFIILIACAWQVVRFTPDNFFTLENFNHLLVPFTAVVIHILLKGARVANLIGLFLMFFIDLHMINFAFWEFPKFNGMAIANSVLIFNHGRLEFIYNQKLGYFAIFSHVGLWIFCAYYKGFINAVPPPDVIFTVFFFIGLQFLWYTYKTSKDYEEIE